MLDVVKLSLFVRMSRVGGDSYDNDDSEDSSDNNDDHDDEFVLDTLHTCNANSWQFGRFKCLLWMI